MVNIVDIGVFKGGSLVLLNESPIGTLLGGGFSDWTLEGELETELSLRLNLAAGAQEPEVVGDPQCAELG